MDWLCIDNSQHQISNTFWILILNCSSSIPMEIWVSLKSTCHLCNEVIIKLWIEKIKFWLYEVKRVDNLTTLSSQELLFWFAWHVLPTVQTIVMSKSAEIISILAVTLLMWVSVLNSLVEMSMKWDFEFFMLWFIQRIQSQIARAVHIFTTIIKRKLTIFYIYTTIYEIMFAMVHFLDINRASEWRKW